MSKNNPAQSFLKSLGSFIADPFRREAVFKHQTLEGRPGDPHAPGDPAGYSSARRRGSLHHEVGGNVGELPTQEPHGLRGLQNDGSIQTLMILLRKAAELFKDNSIASWNEYLTWQDEDVWREGARIFGSEENVRELIDSLPKRESGKNINIDEVPEGLLRDFYVGNKKGRKTPVKPKTKKQPQKAKDLTPAEEGEIKEAVRYIKRLQEAEATPENMEELTNLWLNLFRELGLGQLTADQLKNFFELSFEEKMDVLQSILEGFNLKESGL